MAGDPNNASIWKYADVYVGALDAPNPATVNDPFPEAWGLMGLLDSDDGMSETRDVDTDDKYAWGDVLVRQSRAHFKLTIKVSVLEDNPTTRSLIWPGSTSDTIVVPNPVPVKVAFELRDPGTGVVQRRITRRYAIIDVDGDVDRNETDLTKVPLAAVIFPDASTPPVLFDEQKTPALTGLAVAPTTKSLVVANIAKITATATYDDTSTADVSAEASWTSSAPSKATVEGGYVTGVAAGTSNVVASFGGQTATCAVTVTSS